MRLLFEIDRKNYRENGSSFCRPSMRAVIRTEKGLVMIHSLKYDYYKFPGGGMEKGESQRDALIREVAEETGLTVDPSSIREYGCVLRREKGQEEDVFIQENDYFFCNVRQGARPLHLDAYEEEERFRPETVSAGKALLVNQTHRHGDKEGNPRFASMLERENGVLRLLIQEGCAE